ncbi:hypothetical protein OROMI_011843 [Orobanche minor]
MATMDMMIYEDRITGENILEIESSRIREEVIKGMVIKVKSETIGFFEHMRKYGWLTEEEYAKKRDHEGKVFDLVSDCLVELDDFSEDDFEEYLKGYIKRLKPRLKPEDFTFVEMNMGLVKDYLIPRIRTGNLKAYSGIKGFGDTNAETEGSIVFADTMEADQPPTFLYLAFGLLEYNSPPKRIQKEHDELLKWALSFLPDEANTAAYPSSEDDNMRTVLDHEDPKMNLDYDKRRKLEL